MTPTDVTGQILIEGPMFPSEGHGLESIIHIVVMGMVVVLIPPILTQEIRLRRGRH